MKTIYIKEKENISKFKRLFEKKIQIKNENGHTVLFIPTNQNKVKKTTKKIKKYLETEGTNRIVLSHKLHEFEYLKNSLYSENINILNGRLLFKCLVKQIIEYILRINKMKQSEVSILINDFTPLNNEIIIEIAKQSKKIHIITNNLNKFKRLEKHLYSEYGIIIDTYNSKEKSLLKSGIIINLDFPEELLNKYKINTKAVIINISEKIEINNKKFDGININYFKIRIPKEYKIDGFSDEEIYESIIYDYSFKEKQDIIKKDNIKIIGLIGNRGIVEKQEFRLLKNI